MSDSNLSHVRQIALTEQEQEAEPTAAEQVECLGMTFASDDERRTHFREQLREKLADPAFRAIEGFPVGNDEAILALSDPPYYTACPNPFLEDFIRCYGKPYDPSVPYHREPMAADVSEGKNDPIYNAHSYHTKVPHKAIMRYILHYTEPGDVVFDGFCGTGMTGVAAYLCGLPDPEFRLELTQEWMESSGSLPHWGYRRSVLSDLSPFATFIAYNYNTAVDAAAFSEASRQLLAEVEEAVGWMYRTQHVQHGQGQVDSMGQPVMGRINFTVWSDLFVCPECSHEIVFLDQALDPTTKTVSREISCPNCGIRAPKAGMTRAFETYFDEMIGASVRRVKRVPVLINYSMGKHKFEKTPDARDRELFEQIQHVPLVGSFPSLALPYMHISHIKDHMSNFGITHYQHFFLPRQSHGLAALWNVVNSYPQDRVRNALIFAIEQCIVGMSILNRYSPTHFSQVNQYMSGVLYVPSQVAEVSPWYILEGKFQRLARVFGTLADTNGFATVSLNSGSSVPLSDDSVDYIFTDPPFGENLQYSELNWFVESFYGVFPDIRPEAVVNKAQQKNTAEYMGIMLSCFRENYRILKPGRWMTVEFHNSKNSIWNAIQEAILRAGFVVADIRMLDKQHETYKQVSQGVVKQDLVISAYKPNGGLEQRFQIEAGSEDGVWDFVRTHLRQLPIFVAPKDGLGEMVAERLDYLLFDRMVAFHVQRGVAVPLSAPEFYAGLRRRYPQRDGMFFLDEQVAEYERKRLSVKELQQLTIFVLNESTAIQWLRQQLTNKPQTQAELTPQFMRELAGWEKHEQLPEMIELLEQNFLRYDGEGPIPAQIVAWMKKSADARKVIDGEVAAGHAREDGSLATANATLRSQARERWYVPDPNKAIDLEKLRVKGLLREFAAYSEGRGKLKLFRTEAIKAGFKQAWADRDYATIVRVADRLPESVLQEDADLLMYYDNASLRVDA